MKSNKLLILPVVLTTITLLTGTVLSTTFTHADSNTDVVDELDVTVNSACTMKGGPNGTDDSGSSTYTTTINAGNYTELSGSKLVTLCNNPAGYAIYAIGFSGDSYDSQTHTDLIGTATTGNIPTGTSGDNSYWAMKLEAVEGLTPPSIVTDFQNYHVIPDIYTKVASYTTPTATASDDGATVQTKYKINIARGQLAGSYTGKVKYTMVHPNDAPAPEPPVTNINLYNAVVTAWTAEGSRVLANDNNPNTGIKAAITTSNSGVFKYDSTTFGTSSDAANTSDIYFYRGILDTEVGTYGSDGDNEAHPNTVVLSSASNKTGLTTDDTCWRIVRTTGSGGIKMIYQGKWTGSTCANATTNAQVTTSAFGSTSVGVYRSIVGVGYTRNANYANTSATTATAISTIFGSNASYSGNSTASTMKNYIERTWFKTISSYESKLEPSAGYCNDRTLYRYGIYAKDKQLAESTTVVPYGTSDMTVYSFGSFARNGSNSQPSSLDCPRSTVDLYTTSSASNGNKQLSKPAALLTADEAAFAGSGYFSITPYHTNSYLYSGSNFYLLSPSQRPSGGYARTFLLYSNGYIDDAIVSYAYGVRPAISLISGAIATTGTGTATDPWIVNP